MSDQELNLLKEELEKRVLERTAELARSNQDLQNFASIVSHDLQEPLRKVTTFADLLQAEYADKLEGDGEVYLNYIVDAAARMRVLIQDLLAYSRVATKASPFERIDLSDIVQGVVSDLQIRIDETGGQVILSDLPQVDADPIQMRQLFQNLIGNALKFHKNEVVPVVNVEGEIIAGKEQDLCCLMVSDNGIGFEQRYSEQVFDIFQRLHDREAYEGSGVGLTICRRIVERHGGEIWAESVLGEGTTFKIQMPVKR